MFNWISKWFRSKRFNHQDRNKFNLKCVENIGCMIGFSVADGRVQFDFSVDEDRIDEFIDLFAALHSGAFKEAMLHKIKEYMIEGGDGEMAEEFEMIVNDKIEMISYNDDDPVICPLDVFKGGNNE